ncbi:MmgE/PrpD family protein [Primorskyibacter aestuariivivens]|uniref:MmgE/PrpD family protein n=1 Tax=Primorskyibacter aestuariivivens TaxID=1888912 RepID=UPI0023018465|nr:MmgE/PrpD family protein [Primorskyibacter aestuariivivens]MDA7428705.1 MmgE/PrpD family protein [Primorskyibacter aestuariivivens]
MTDPLSFLRAPLWDTAPQHVRDQAKLCLLDLTGIAIGGHGTDLSAIIRNHAALTRPGPYPLPFDGRGVNGSGLALALGMSIDALDGHDGFNPAKGHIGCPMMPAALGFALSRDASGVDFLDALLMGYEFGARASVAQHGTVPDYHTSGSWGAVTAAATGARLMGLSPDQTRHALGIAEYHGPRSQMMRCIDHPTMLKDGSGWGAMCGVEAVGLAQAGFTGAPAITVEEAPEFWADLGQHWAIMDQYFKPYPVCRWAQAPVEGVLALRAAHGLNASDIAHIEVETFHEAIRLAKRRPASTEEAQYSTSFPCALAAVHGEVRPDLLSGAALSDPEVLRLSDSLIMRETDEANAPFPATRLARVTLHLTDGREVKGEYRTPKWDAEAPPTEAELRAKYHALADPVLGTPRADEIEAAIDRLEDTPTADFFATLSAPA